MACCLCCRVPAATEMMMMLSMLLRWKLTRCDKSPGCSPCCHQLTIFSITEFVQLNKAVSSLCTVYILGYKQRNLFPLQGAKVTLSTNTRAAKEFGGFTYNGQPI
jgi:hypothetical protein